MPVYPESGPSLFRALTAAEWADLERRHLARGGSPIARADSVSSGPHDQPMDASGLFKHVAYDQANRPVITFTLPEGQTKMSTWMGAYAAPAQLQVAMTNNVETTRRQFQRYLADHPEAQT